MSFNFFLNGTTREISSNVLNLNELAQHNDHSLKETTAAANDVSRQAEELKSLVGLSGCKYGVARNC